MKKVTGKKKKPSARKTVRSNRSKKTAVRTKPKDPLGFLPDEFFSLPENRQTFVLEYLRTGDRFEAYRKAGYKGEEQAGSWRLLRDATVNRVVDMARGNLMREQAMDVAEVHAHLSSIGRGRITDVLSWDGDGSVRFRPSEELDDAIRHAIKSVKVKRKTHLTESGETTTTDMTVEMHDKIGALDKIARIHKMYGEQSVSTNPLFDLLAQVDKRNRVDAEYEEIKTDAEAPEGKKK